jgi:chromosome segregation ATPase
MATIFFLISLLCGIAIAAVSAKLFTDTKKGASFMGITLATPQPAIAGIVLGVLVLLGSLIVFLPLSSQVSELDDKLKRSEGSLSSTRKRLESTEEENEGLQKARDEKAALVAEAEGKIKDLEKELQDKQDASVVATGDVDRYKEEINSITQRLLAKTKEAEGLASELGLAKGRIETLAKDLEDLNKVLEAEKEFRRDFMLLVEEEQANESSLTGKALKIYMKLLDLRNKYK